MPNQKGKLREDYHAMLERILTPAITPNVRKPKVPLAKSLKEMAKK